MSTFQVFKNNADSTMNGALAIGATFFNVAVGHGVKFPSLSAGQYAVVTLFERNVSGVEINHESVKVTNITGDTLTVVRDFEGIVQAAGGTSGGWAYPSEAGINPSQVVYVQLRYTAYAANNNLTKDGNLEGIANPTTARTNLGLAIGTNVQGYDATLAALAGVTVAADKVLYATGADAFATTSLTSFARTLLDDADAATARGTLAAAPLASPTFTGTPTVPTAAQGTSTTQAASTAFVNAEIAADAAPIAHVGASGVAHAAATTAVAGFMSAADKAKLDAITGTHTGTNTGDQTITLTGDVTGSGTGSFATTLANSGATAGTYRSVTVNAKGLVTGGTNPTTLAGYGITDAQTLDATLTAFAGITFAADTIPYATAADTFSTTTLSSFARTILDDTSASAVRTTIGAQALDATLTALAGVTVAADKVIYATAADTFTTTTLTSFARTLLDDADAATARTTLGVGIGTAVQAYDAATAKTNTTQVFSAVQKSTVTTDNDLTIDLATAMDVVCTPTAGGTLTFSNIAAGQKFEILFINNGNYPIVKGSNIKSASTLFTTISIAGRYILAGRCLDGTNIDLTVSGALS